MRPNHGQTLKAEKWNPVAFDEKSKRPKTLQAFSFGLFGCAERGGESMCRSGFSKLFFKLAMRLHKFGSNFVFAFQFGLKLLDGSLVL